MTETTSKNIAIIGAGISGLSAAYHLQKAGHHVSLLEKSDTVGGAIKTTRTSGYLIEHGPNSILLSDPRVRKLIAEIGIEKDLTPANTAAKNRFIIHGSKLNPLPTSPLKALTTPLFSFKAKMRALKEILVAKRDARKGTECFADFVRRRFGQEILDKAADPFVNGIYAGDSNRLATRHAFPKLWNLEQEHGSILRGLIARRRSAKKANPQLPKGTSPTIASFTNGMQTLPEAISAALRQETLSTSTEIEFISHSPQTRNWSIKWKSKTGTIAQGVFDHLIITSPAHELPNLPLQDNVRDALSKLPDISYPPVTTLFLGFKRSQVRHPLDGFGMLSSPKEKNKMLGALFNSSLFPARAPDDHVAVNVMLGGSRTPELARMSESELKASVMDELRKLLGVEGQPAFTNLIRWEKAIPQFNLGYSKVIEQIEQAERDFPGLHIAGNYRDGISVPDCIVAGINLTEKIASQTPKQSQA